MTDKDDGDDDDLGLEGLGLSEDRIKSLRSVWLSMPDEDPPERGIAALMAAASAKAAQMSPPDNVAAGSGVMTKERALKAHARAKELAAAPVDAPPGFFGKMLDVMRRPSVLAMATVMVLVGGAVLVKRHEGEMTSAVRAPIAPSATAPNAPSTLPGLFALDAGAVIEHRFETSGSGSGSGSAAPRGHDDTERTGVVDHDTRNNGPGSASTQLHVAKPVPPPPPPPPPNNQNPVPDSNTIDPGAEGRAGGDAFDEKPMTPPQQGQTAHPTNDKTTTGTNQTTKTPEAETMKPTLTTDQLLAQCKSAAQRGDCGSARDLANRIAKSNATVYRDKVLRDETIAKCLGSSATINATD